MTGRIRLPGGQPRKASQRNTRRAAPIPPAPGDPELAPGDKVRWKGRDGTFRREVGDGEHAEVAIAERAHRVRIGELA